MVTGIGCLFANFIALFGLTPLYPEVAHDLELGPDGFGLYILVQGAVALVFQLPVGIVSDRIGRRPVLALGLVFLAASQLLRWRAATGFEFGVGQIFIGFCSPFVVAAVYALVADAYQGAGRAQAIGILQACANIGQATGILLAASLSPLIGWRGYSLVIAILPIFLLPLVPLTPELNRAAPTTTFRAAIGSALRFLVGARALTLAGAGALTLCGYGGAIFLLPFVSRAAGISEVSRSLILLPVLAGSAIGGIVIGRWADRSGFARPALLSMGAGGLGLLALGVLGFSPGVALVANFLVGIATSAGIALAASGVVELALKLREGTGASLAAVRIGQNVGAA